PSLRLAPLCRLQRSMLSFLSSSSLEPRASLRCPSHPSFSLGRTANQAERAVVRILGIVSETHDSGLALLEDGIPALVLEEERFNREKHTLKFPQLSLNAAIAELKLGIADIDVITTPWDILELRKTAAKAILSGLPGSFT